MKKDKRNMMILVAIIITVIVISYFIFVYGLTDKLKGNVERLTAEVNDGNVSDLPVINYVINSSGEKLVNTDVALTINATSKYNIDKIEYSFDLEKWQEIKDAIDDKKISYKLIFTKTDNRKVYIRVQNEKGYKSYAYETKVMIDKKVPVISLTYKDNEVLINAADENGLSSIQYSNDKENWDEEETSGEKVTLRKNDFGYKYIRSIDSVGNISEIKEVK